MSQSEENRRDWRISAVLLSTWIVALVLVGVRRDDIPWSMLGLATVFFVLLIPAMNDLVRSIERYAFGRNADGGSERTKE
jgi:hypothetical membrane protein